MPTKGDCGGVTQGKESRKQYCGACTHYCDAKHYLQVQMMKKMTIDLQTIFIQKNPKDRTSLRVQMIDVHSTTLVNNYKKYTRKIKKGKTIGGSSSNTS